MAKSKARMDLPTVDAEGVEMQQDEITSGEVTATVEVPQLISKMVRVPLAQIPFGYLPRVCDVRKMTGKQSQALRQLQEALCSQGATLANGTRINNPSNAIKWLLESIAS